MRGLVLEGGGALGAYQVGAIKALEENNITFDGAVGTSIGSINAAMYIQGGAELLERIWTSIDIDKVFYDVEITDFMSNFNIRYALEHKHKISKVIKAGGIEIDGFHNLIKESLDENIIRNSPMDYGLVTFCRTDMQGKWLYKEDIPEGNLSKFIVASCYLPGFKREQILGKYYYDGAFADNLPFNMLIDKGYKELYMIQIGGAGIVKDIPKSKNYHLIKPRKVVGNSWDFTNETIMKKIQQGYFDTMVYLGEYRGIDYTFDLDMEKLKETSIPNEGDMIKLCKIMGLPKLKGKENFYMYILPVIGKILKLKFPSYEEILINLIEHYLKENHYPEDILYEDNVIDLIKASQGPFSTSYSQIVNNIISIIFK